MSHTRKARLAHVVYRTRRFEAMLAWYQAVFNTHVQSRNPALAFLTYDDEHHRFAFADLNVIHPGSGEVDKRGLVGVDHVAYTVESVHALLHDYARLKALGILPYWCIHHGLTVSMYYADPDGNQMEFQVDAFDTAEQCNQYITGPMFDANPIGVEFDPQVWLHRLRDGETEANFRARLIHEPVSPIRGAIAHMMD